MKRWTPAAWGLSAVLSLTVSCTNETSQGPPATTLVEEPTGGQKDGQGSAIKSRVTENDTPPMGQVAEISTNLRFEPAVDWRLGFSHVAGRSPEKFMPETMGGGVVVADFNRDAAPDVLFINSGRIFGPARTEPSSHRLFLYQQGEFVDGTTEWGISSLGYGMGGTTGDFDNDGWTDLYLTTFDGNDRLLRNTGRSFIDVTQQAGLSGVGGWSTSAGFLDMDNDGDLDLYVVKYVDYSVAKAIPCYAKGHLVYCTPVMFNALPDRLFRNNGDGTYTDVSASAGAPTRGKGLALAIGDVDRDGDSDIYVANDTTANSLLINNGQGQFADKASLLGVGYSSLGNEEAGMGADFCDINHDGLFDIACTNFQAETTCLYIQQPKGYFIERSDGLGVGATARLRLSFGLDFFDADNDGDEDLLVVNGHVDTDVDKYQSGVGYGQLNTLYEQRDGRLWDVTQIAGTALATTKPSRGLATGDLDNDGDLDFIVVNTNTDAEIALNVSADIGHFLSLWLEGANCNRSAIGTVVSAKIGDRRITREVMGASSYLSACDNRLHFGLSRADQIDEIVIRWPGGTEQKVSDLAAGAHYHLIEGRDPVEVQPGEQVIAPE